MLAGQAVIGGEFLIPFYSLVMHLWGSFILSNLYKTLPITG
jgi:hypothetical protein